MVYFINFNKIETNLITKDRFFCASLHFHKVRNQILIVIFFFFKIQVKNVKMHRDEFIEVNNI